jgi:hypothetical protein
MAIKRTPAGLGYADSQKDIRAELVHFSDHGEGSYFPTKFADAVCACGRREFMLELDDAAGVAIRTCGTCGTRHVMADGASYLDDAADLDDRECFCGSPLFEITVGVSLYRGSNDVRWLYVGCRCPACGLAGCYGEWKNEFDGHRALLANV